MKRLAEYLAPRLVTLLMKSLKIKLIYKHKIPANAVYIFWHGKMLGGWWALRKLNPGALVSMSKDGELLSRLLTGWGYKLFRGSSSVGGKAALKELSSFISKGNSGVVTPDGPRGPAGYLKNGALLLSLENNIPIIPMKIEYLSRKILEKSWDHFEVPLPFSNCTITFGSPVHYSAKLDGDDLDNFKRILAEDM